MALNGITLYFPWGAGGNLVKNILSLDTEFEFIDDKEWNEEYPTQESRYVFLKDYYQQDVSSDNWLSREWTIRHRPHAKYFYMNGIGYWNPDYKLIYDVHGTPEELLSILLDKKLQCYDRARIDTGERAEQMSSWTIQETAHVFLIADDIQNFIDVYASKNHDLDKNHSKFNQSYLNEATRQNTFFNQRLQETATHLQGRGRDVMIFTAEALFRDTGYQLIESISQHLNLNINPQYIRELHAIWLQSTRELYYNLHNKPLEI